MVVYSKTCLANIRTFADDTTLFYSSNALEDLKKTINEEFNHLLSYCSANKLSVNFKKTHYMAISSPQKANKLKLNLRNIEEKNYTHTHTPTLNFIFILIILPLPPANNKS